MQDVQEGTRRRSKSTGEVQVMRGGQWVSEGGAPASAAPIILGPPEKPKPKDPPSGYLDTPGGLTPIPGGPADPYRPGGELDPHKPDKEDKPTDTQRANAGYYARMVATDRAYGGGVDPRSVTSQMLADLVPSSVRNANSSPARRAAQNYADDWIRAKLRKESGAVIGADEMQREYEVYFPQPGDGPEDLTRKAALRQQATAAMRVSAGGQADSVEILDLPTVASIVGEKVPPPTGDAPEVDENGDPIPELVGGGKAKAERERLAAEAARREAEAIGPAGAGDLLVQGATLGLSDEAAGVGRAISKLVTGGNPTEGYVLGRDAERLRLDATRKRLGAGGTALEIGGGFLSANPETVISPITSALGTIRAGAKTGAIGGALAGYGYGEGLEGSATGAAVGGLVGGALGGGVSALSTRIAPKAGIDRPLADAAAAERVHVSEPMFAGNRRAVNRAGVLEADPTTAPIVQEGFARTANDIEAGVARLGQGGEAMERGPAGEMVREAAKRIKAADREASNAAYKAAEAIDGDPMIDAAAVRAKIDAEIAKLQRTPSTNQAAIRELQRYRADLEKPLPLSALRDMRTSIRSNVNGSDLTRSSAQKAADKRMLGIIDGTKDDIKGALSPEAWDAWSAADADYAGHMAFIKDALVPFVGKDFDQLPAERIFDRLKNAANSNGRALAALHRRLSPEESRGLAATFADKLGRAGEGEPFSAARFISQAKTMSDSARKTIFGPSGGESFNNLLRLSRRLEQAKGQVNQSKTARPVVNAVRQKMGQIVTLLMGGGGFAAGGPVGGGIGLAAGATASVVGAARRALSAQALMNPRVSKLLLEGATVNTDAQAANWAQRFSNVIAREPALAGELGPMQSWIGDVLSRSPGKAAAADQENQ